MTASRGPRLPDFLIVGAQKCGTTWVASQLARHPEVWVHPEELHYFNDPERLARGPRWYAAQFAGARGARRVGEKTPGYLCAGLESVGNPRVHEAMHALLPEARLVAVLRDPVDRAISAFQHHLERGRIPADAAPDDVLLGRRPELERAYGFFERGLYARQLEALFERYPRERVHVMVYEEDVRDAPERGLAALCRFLEVADDFRFPAPRRRVNPAGAAAARARGPAPSPACREALARRFAPENRALFALLGRPPAAWGKPQPSDP